MRMAWKAGLRAMLAAGVGASLWTSSVVAQELSEKSLRTFMEYAWSLTPAKFTRPDGKTIEIDKKKKDEVMVGIDVAREVIRVGRLSAHAQVCELGDDQVANYRSLMLREEQKKKWTEQQLIYINQLHLTTVMLLTGKLKLVEREGEERVPIEEPSRAPTQTCTNEQRAKVSQMVAAYVKAGPSLTTNAEAAGAPATAAAAVTPTAAPAPKK